MVWLALCGLYIQFQLGWENFSSGLPHERAVTVLGVLIPLALIWIVTGLYARMRALGASAKVLADRLDALVYPSEAAEERARIVSANLEAQSTALSTAAVAAVDHLDNASALLADRLKHRPCNLWGGATMPRRSTGSEMATARQKRVRR